MSDSILDKTIALRREAWEQVKATPAYAAYRAIDNAVVALGGDSALLSGALKPGSIYAPPSPPKRISQTDAAASALREGGMPLPIGRFMEAAIEKGADVGGANPINNFRSALSKDPRFEAVKRNGMYFWWFAGEPLPLRFQDQHKETADPDLLAESAASSSSSQEGGESHAATTLT